MKKILVVLLIMSLTACSSFATNTSVKSNTQEVTPCTNGFDSVDVCQLTS